MRGCQVVTQRRWTVLAVAAAWLVFASFGFSDDDQPAVEKKAEAKPAATDKKQAEPADAQKKPPANPLSKLIRNIFGGDKPAERPAVPAGELVPADDPDGTKPAGNGDKSARDHIDTRAPYDTRQASLLRRAEALMKDGQHDQAARALQLVLDKVEEHEDSVVRRPDGRLESVRAHAIGLLGRLPAAALESYRREHGDFARQKLLDARLQGDPAGIAQVADTYFHTEAGREAADYLGTQHVDRGEFGPAARRFLQLLEADAPLTHAPQWRLKAAVAFREAGMADGLARLRSQLNDPATGSLRLGGRDVQPAAWLDELGAIAGVAPPRLDEWRMLYGSPRRTGTAVGGDPLLLERWFSPLTYNQEVNEQVEILLEDLADQNRAAIPAWHPLTVGDKVVFRTLRGVQVVNADTGQAVWETRAGISPERLLAGQPVQQYAGQVFPGAFGGMGRGGMRFSARYSGGTADQHPLTGLLFRDGAFGLLSSHEDKLFVIEDHAILSQQQPGYNWGRRQNQNDAYRRDWSSNKLTAYNLADGRPVWEVGGPDTREAIQLPLAGTYFFGPPTPDGRELFAVGEKDNEIRLFSLDSQTGRPNWSQLLAVSEARIDEDIGRRWWTAQAAVAGGVIVCPTTVGWLVAVDRTSRAILWAYRYSPPVENGRRNNNFGGRNISVVPNSTLDQQWCPSAPVIAGNRVLYTPSEYTDPNSQQTALVCLNLSDGTRLWQASKENNRYLAGVFDGRAVLVGSNSIAALSLDDGTAAWSSPIPESDGKPSGFGVAVGDRYHLPLSSGQLWTVDLTDGKVVGKSYLAGRAASEGWSGRLGNLAMHRGMLLSLSPLGLTSFEQREAIVAEIRRRKQADPNDPWALLREADIHLLRREHEPALALLKRISADQVDAEQTAHYRSQMIACLTEVVRSDFASRTRELDELAAFARLPEEKLHVRRLTAEQLEALGQRGAAFDVYRELAEESSSEMVRRVDNSRVELPLDLWLAGRMGDLWSQMDDQARENAGREILADASRLQSSESPAALERFVALYDFHPAARPVRQRLAEVYAERGELAGAQAQLMHLARSADEKVAAGALHDLAGMMQKRRLADDARYYYQLLADRHTDVEIDEGMTARALYEQLQADGSLKQAGDADRATWGDYDLRMERTGANYSSSQSYDLKSGSFRLPYFRQFRFEIDGQQKLAMMKVADGELHWLVPLRGQARSQQNFPVAQAAGHRLFVLYRDVVHCLSPVERKVLWTHALETRGQAGGHYHHPNQQTVRPMQTLQSLLSGQALVQHNSENGMLAVANSSYVCVYGRRQFTVLDAATGQIRWTRDHVPAFARLVGNEDVLYMVPQNRSEAVAFRALDGKRLDVDDVGGLLARAVHISERGLALMESGSRSGILGLGSSSDDVVRQLDPLTKQDRWRHSFPTGAYFTLLDGDLLAALRKDGTFALLDLESGRITELGKLEESDLKSRSGLHVLADRDNVYLVANQNRRSGSYYSLGLPFVRVDGTVFAFDRSSGKQVWKQTVSNQNLVLNQFEHSPVMMFAMRTYVRKGRLNHWTLDVVAVDKATGRKLIDAKSPFNSSFRSVDVNLADRFVELRSYNDRIRLIAVNRDAGEAVEAPEPAAVN